MSTPGNISHSCSPAGENEDMMKCKKCGKPKRRWPRSCSRCRSKWDRTDAAEDVVDIVVEEGLFSWIWRGVMAVVRLVLN
jgi:predicted amidophosphoribosyltransferase